MVAQLAFANLRIEEEESSNAIDENWCKPKDPAWFDEAQILFRSKHSGLIYTYKHMLMEKSFLLEISDDAICKPRLQEINRRLSKLRNMLKDFKTYGMPFLFYKARIGVMDMLFDRGYDVDTEQIHASYADFTSRFIEDLTSDGPYFALDCLTFIAARKADPSDKVLVLFLNAREVNLQTIQDIYMKYCNENLTRVIPVVWNYMAPKDVEVLQSLSPFKLEFFHVFDLYNINLSASVKRRKYVVLTAKEKEELFKVISLDNIKTCVIDFHHPSSEYYGLEKGQMVKVVAGEEELEMVSPDPEYIIIR